MSKAKGEGSSRFPFQATEKELLAGLDGFIDATIDSLSSYYMELPRGDSFLEYPGFEQAYEVLLKATKEFKRIDRDAVRQAVAENGRVLCVLRGIVGLSPPELADYASETQGIPVSQSFARNIDAKARRGAKLLAAKAKGKTVDCVNALIDAACLAIEKGPERSSEMVIHRLSKVDTIDGWQSVAKTARAGVPYPVLLYERMLGRSFATHRDAVSSQVGHVVEEAVVKELQTAGIPFYQTRRIEKLKGFDQAPDFLIPSKEAPEIIIEAKVAQDDGTARDKVTRVQHLERLSESGTGFEVIACIDGRGFRERRENMRKLLLATQGKVFTVETMRYLVDYTGLNRFRQVK